RPDERHIRYNDVRELKKVVKTEFNIEGYPCDSFIDLVLEVLPNQVTLVPDPPEALTSSSGWDTITHGKELSRIVKIFKDKGIRVSIFLNPDPNLIQSAAETGTDRVELYTEPYATLYPQDRETAIKYFVETALEAQKYNLGINAGHDLSLKNLRYFHENIPNLLEVSIGHALISDALYLGLENTIQLYRRELTVR
ncbi:MAG: pyridoxine 5'-phosphate synthase, partial [Rikenellaceae bacterium]